MSTWSRIWEEIAARPSGPFALRFYLQPLMATIFAVRDGIKDARAGRPPYLSAMVRDPEQRRALVKSWWRSAGKIFVLAIVLDLLYQLFVLKGLRPIEGLVVAVVLAILPYLIFRGPANRIAHRLFTSGRRSHTPA